MKFLDFRSLTAAFLIISGTTSALASDGHTGWSATLYGGPATQRIFTQIVGDGKFDVNDGMIGLAVDKRLIRLGWGISIAGEGQVTQFFGTHAYDTFALGVGLRLDSTLWNLPTSLAIYSGPSYAIDPPIELYVKSRKQHPFLNYIGIEIAVAIPHHERHWDAVLRIYHRSGAWGVYSINADEGSMIGIGIRAKF